MYKNRNSHIWRISEQWNLPTFRQLISVSVTTGTKKGETGKDFPRRFQFNCLFRRCEIWMIKRGVRLGFGRSFRTVQKSSKFGRNGNCSYFKLSSILWIEYKIYSFHSTIKHNIRQRLFVRCIFSSSWVGNYICPILNQHDFITLLQNWWNIRKCSYYNYIIMMTFGIYITASL